MKHECPPMELLIKSSAVITQDLDRFTLSLSSENDTLSIQINNCPFCGKLLGKPEHKTPKWATGTY